MDTIVNLTNDYTVGSNDKRQTGKDLFNTMNGRCEIILDLTMIADAALPFTVFCYNFESDDFNAPLIYEAWERLRRHGRRITGRSNTPAPADAEPTPPRAPLTEALLQAWCGPDPATIKAHLGGVIQKAIYAFDKLEQYSREEIHVQLGVFRACRILNPYWIQLQQIPAVQAELVQLRRIPRIAASIPALTAELPDYYAAAVALGALQAGVDFKAKSVLMWEFWRTQKLQLETWYAAAAEVALIMTASASSERIFSLYSTLFTNSQRSCLEDIVQTSMQQRYNENQRAKDV
jgi:hypothetical protein